MKKESNCNFPLVTLWKANEMLILNAHQHPGKITGLLSYRMLERHIWCLLCLISTPNCSKHFQMWRSKWKFSVIKLIFTPESVAFLTGKLQENGSILTPHLFQLFLTRKCFHMYFFYVHPFYLAIRTTYPYSFFFCHVAVHKQSIGPRRETGSF